jgi:hypothetical protein
VGRTNQPFNISVLQLTILSRILSNFTNSLHSSPNPLKSHPLPTATTQSHPTKIPQFHPHTPPPCHTPPVPHGYTARRGGQRGRFRVLEADAAFRICRPSGGHRSFPWGKAAGVSRKTVTRRDREQGRLPPTRRLALHKLIHGFLPTIARRAKAVGQGVSSGRWCPEPHGAR